MTMLAKIICTFLYVGYLPKAPGTWGSLAGLLLYALLNQLSWPLATILTITTITFLVGWAASQTLLKCQNFQNTDPKFIIIDEVVGMWLTLALVQLLWAPQFQYNRPFFMLASFLAFVSFRLFDIAKIFPIHVIEHQLAASPKTAALGIMLDDVLASIYAAILTNIMLYFLAVYS